MRILIIGASGRVGKLVVQGALARGHTVTALVRNKTSLDSIAATESTLNIIKGQSQEKANVEKAFAAVPNDVSAVVIVTLNNARTSDNPFANPTSPPTLMHDAHVNVLASMNTHDTRKLVTLQAHGVGDSFPTLFIAVRMLVRYSNLGIGYKDHEQVEKLVEQSGVTYVLARPVRFVEGLPAAIRVYGDEGEGVGAFASITRESVATFLLDAAEKDEWDGNTPVISN